MEDYDQTHRKEVLKTIVITRADMLEDYRNHSKCCYLIFEEKYQMNGKWWMGGILGMGSNMQMAPFAYFMLRGLLQGDFASLIKTFFGIVKEKPEILITQIN